MQSQTFTLIQRIPNGGANQATVNSIEKAHAQLDEWAERAGKPEQSAPKQPDRAAKKTVSRRRH